MFTTQSLWPRAWIKLVNCYSEFFFSKHEIYLFRVLKQIPVFFSQYLWLWSIVSWSVRTQQWAKSDLSSPWHDLLLLSTWQCELKRIHFKHVTLMFWGLVVIRLSYEWVIRLLSWPKINALHFCRMFEPSFSTFTETKLQTDRGAAFKVNKKNCCHMSSNFFFCIHASQTFLNGSRV